MYLFATIGGIGGPVLFGVAIDNACTLWDEYCGETGSCLSYNPSSLGLNLFILCTVVKGLSAVAIGFAWKLYKPPVNDTDTISEEAPGHTKGSENNGYVGDEKHVSYQHPDHSVTQL